MTLKKRSGPLTPGVAFITGGARGLGNAIGVAFARDGARGVVIVDINDEATMAEGKANIEAYGTKCLAIRADVSNEEDVKKAIAATVAEFGRIDYAANMAGITGAGVERSWDTEVKNFEKVIAVNTTGTFICTKLELQQMMKQEPLEDDGGDLPQRGSIINAASVMSQMSHDRSVMYSTSKHAVVGITKTAALEARKHNIRVNAISPGFVNTLMNINALKESGEIGREIWRHAESRQGRSLTPEEIGSAVAMLSTPRMSVITGQNIPVDNGFTMNAGRE